MLDDGPGGEAFSQVRADPAGGSVADIDPAVDVAVLPYSSGTTGMCKGVMLSHRALVAHNAQMLGQDFATHVNAGERVLMVLPLFHIFVITSYSIHYTKLYET